MITKKYRLTGVAPLLMKNGQLVDKRNEYTRQLDALVKISKKQKTDANQDAVTKMEWRGSLYVNEAGVVALPGDVIYSAVIEGARKSKQGKEAQAGVYEAQPFFPLKYDGPKNLDKLYEDRRFVDIRGVGVNQKRIMRTRPKFPTWSCDIALNIQEDIMDPADVFVALRKCGELIGVGDYRPRFGRFNVEEL